MKQIVPINDYSINLPIVKWIYEDEVFQGIANSIDPALDDDMKFASELAVLI